MRKQRWIFGFLAAAMLFGLCGCMGQGGGTRLKPRLTVYLPNASLLGDYAPTLQKMVPEAELEFVVGRGSVDFYLLHQEKGELPDIMTLSGGLPMRDSVELNDHLMDLSGTETASSFYDTYLENLRDSEGNVYWLPAGGNANGIIANTDLFEQYGIPLPTDYESFAAACEAFAQEGIQPYTSDYKYPYTCLYTLEGWAIPTLISRQGVEWRRKYERGGTDRLEEAVWRPVFDRFARFLEDSRMGEAEIERGFTATLEDFTAGKIPMVRGMASELSTYSQHVNCVLLPYFGGTEEDNWLLTAPRFYVALNGALEGEKRELALRVLDAMFSLEGYQALTAGEYIYLLPFHRGVKAALPDAMQNLAPVIEQNHLYILMSCTPLQMAAQEAVWGMLREELDAQGAYERMDASLADPPADQETAAVLEKGYPVSFDQEAGNQAGSAIANTLRDISGCQVLLAPSFLCTGSLFAGEYTEQQLNDTMQAGGNRIYSGSFTGREIRELARLAVEGYGIYSDPFSNQTLPLASGCTLVVLRDEEGYHLEDVLLDGTPLDDEAVYSLALVDLPAGFQPLAEAALGEGYEGRFTATEDYARTLWVEYLKEGNQPLEPTPYIALR